MMSSGHANESGIINLQDGDSYNASLDCPPALESLPTFQLDKYNIEKMEEGAGDEDTVIKAF